MSPTKIVRSKEPIRLFKSDFIEFFTHIHPAVIVVVWAPVVIYFLVRAIQLRPAGTLAWYIPVAYVVGLFLWTLAEYVIHRFVFHAQPRTPWQERLSFLMHGVHHAKPLDKTRQVMPPVVSIPMAAVFYGLYWLILDVLLGAPHVLAALFSAFILGYLAYDLTHYSLHHVQMRSGYARFVRRYHMHHHQETPNQRFGVTSPLWDMVFGTRPPEQTPARAR